MSLLQHAQQSLHSLTHGPLVRLGPDGFAAALGQIWTHCGVVVAVATGSVAVTVTWLVGVAGLVVFHLSRAAVVWLERGSKFKHLEARMAELDARYESALAELRHERAEHARDREKYFQLVEQLIMARSGPGEGILPPAPMPPM